MSEERNYSADTNAAVDNLFPNKQEGGFEKVDGTPPEKKPFEALPDAERHTSQVDTVLGEINEILEGKSDASEEVKEVVDLDDIEKVMSNDTSSKDSVNLEESSNEAVEEPIKTIPVNFGEETYDIPEDAKIEVTVDGEKQVVSLSDFRNDVSGQLAIQKRFSSLDRDKKMIQSQIDLWNDGERQVQQLLSEGRAKDALTFLASRTGMVNPGVFFQQIAKEITPMVQDYMKMTPEQRQQLEMQNQQDSYKQQMESAQSELKQMQAKQEQVSRVRSVQKAYGLNDAEYVEAYDSLMDDLETGRIKYDQSVTPEDVGDYMLYNRYADWSKEAIASVDPKLQGDSRVVHDFVIEAKRLFDKGYDINPDSLKQIAQYVYGNGVSTPKPQPKAQRLPKASNGLKSPQPIAGHWMNNLVSDLEGIQSAEDRKRINKKWGNT